MDSARSDSAATFAEPARATALRSFDSTWFIIPQGTGVLAVCLWMSEYQFQGLHIIAIVAWALTIISFLVVLAVYLARAVVFSKYTATQLTTNNSELAGIASVPVIFSSIVQLLGCVLGMNSGWSMATYVMWWIGMAASLLIMFTISPSFATTLPPSIDNLLPNSQLPIVAVLTTASVGGSICQTTAISPELQAPVVVVSYLFVGIGLPFAVFLDAIFLARLFNQTKEGQRNESRMQKQALAYQIMILTGPWGQSSVAMLTLGKTVLSNGLAESGDSVLAGEMATKIVAYFSIFSGILLWGHATFWWAFALWNISHTVFDKAAVRKRPQFQIAAWSMIFPWGVYANGATQLGQLLDSTAFRVWSAILILSMTILWLSFTFLTLHGCVSGSLLGLEHGWRQRPYPDSSDTETGNNRSSSALNGNRQVKRRPVRD